MIELLEERLSGWRKYRVRHGKTELICFGRDEGDAEFVFAHVFPDGDEQWDGKPIPSHGYVDQQYARLLLREHGRMERPPKPQQVSRSSIPPQE